ncbi:hypothetical protein [Natrarchaeobaculum sulfurireducens]|uniref:Uncharacterized protein n=1 Tax=Natrarchaeobaculum sulfurireducens TaxID=2044521 RepID=A0A346PLZ7_9EURY|nr:hypothetical protein [Natrarchaeobaculum sulfurireducens]AXR76876.1 hypothetical protein AArc1_0532 [Natrarchaeobaculum sulfurireducens]AXR80542.1 hypothetical protein AArcMg_0519 [Natrarchaeobaculum sulfurireducens]
MVSRRAALALIGTGLGGAVLDRAVLRPALQVQTGVSRLHSASDRVIVDGLEPEASDSFSTVAPAEATALTGEDAPEPVSEALERAEADRDDRLTVVVQLRSTSDSPRRLQVRGVDWRGPRTLEVRAQVDEWGSLSSVDAEERERLHAAAWLTSTGIWSLSPCPRLAPSRAVLVTE